MEQYRDKRKRRQLTTFRGAGGYFAPGVDVSSREEESVGSTDAIDPTVVSFFPNPTELADDTSVVAGQVAFSEIKEHDIAIVGIAIEFLHYQCVVGNPGDFGDDTIIFAMAIFPVKMQSGLLGWESSRC